MKADKYSYRMDGLFWVRKVCCKCAEFFDVHAMANAYGATGLCPACEQVDKWMEASSDSA